jgi:hypothetical protein
VLARAGATALPAWIEPALMRHLQWRGRLSQGIQSDPILLTWALRTMAAGPAALPSGVIDRLGPAIGHPSAGEGPYDGLVRAIAARSAAPQVAQLVATAATTTPGDARAMARLAAGVIYSTSCTPAARDALLQGSRAAGLVLPPQAAGDPVQRYYAALAWRALGICHNAPTAPAHLDYGGTVRAALATTAATPGDWQTWPQLWLEAEIECTVTGHTSLQAKAVNAAQQRAAQGELRERYDVPAAYALVRVGQIARSGCQDPWWQPQ